MTRKTSLAVGSAVMLAVVSATIAMALNAGFVSDSSAGVVVEEAPATSTTTYEQYLEEYYEANPTTTLAPTTTTSAEPVVVYEYVDVPVTVPPPQVIYVEVPAAAPPTTVASTVPVGTAPPSSTQPPASSTVPPSTNPPTTTAGPTTTAAPELDLLEFDFYGFADITVASHGPGDSLQFWQIEQDSPWVWEIESDNGSEVKAKFFNTSTGKEAKFEFQIRGDGYRLKTEGDGLSEHEENL